MRKLFNNYISTSLLQIIVALHFFFNYYLMWNIREMDMEGVNYLSWPLFIPAFYFTFKGFISLIKQDRNNILIKQSSNNELLAFSNFYVLPILVVVVFLMASSAPDWGGIGMAVSGFVIGLVYLVVTLLISSSRSRFILFMLFLATNVFISISISNNYSSFKERAQVTENVRVYSDLVHDTILDLEFGITNQQYQAKETELFQLVSSIFSKYKAHNIDEVLNISRFTLNDVLDYKIDILRQEKGRRERQMDEFYYFTKMFEGCSYDVNFEYIAGLRSTDVFSKYGNVVSDKYRIIDIFVDNIFTYRIYAKMDVYGNISKFETSSYKGTDKLEYTNDTYSVCGNTYSPIYNKENRDNNGIDFLLFRYKDFINQVCYKKENTNTCIFNKYDPYKHPSTMETI